MCTAFTHTHIHPAVCPQYKTVDLHRGHVELFSIIRCKIIVRLILSRVLYNTWMNRVYLLIHTSCLFIHTPRCICIRNFQTHTSHFSQKYSQTVKMEVHVLLESARANITHYAACRNIYDDDSIYFRRVFPTWTRLLCLQNGSPAILK